MSNPKGDDGDQLVAEEIGNRAATRLLNEIYNVFLRCNNKNYNYEV